MSKSINIVDKNNVLIASITDGNIIFKGDYKIIESDGNDVRFRGDDEGIKVIRPEISEWTRNRFNEDERHLT